MAKKAEPAEKKIYIRVGLSEEEFAALREYSTKQVRHPTDQAALLLRKALIEVRAIVIPDKKTGRD